MYSVLVFIALVAQATLSSPVESTTSATDERAINIPSQKHVASVRYFNSHICGGAVVSNRAVVTAAHCVLGLQIAPLSVRIETVVTVTQSVLNGFAHGLYQSNSDAYNIALLFFQSTIFGSDTIIGLPPAGYVPSIGLSARFSMLTSQIVWQLQNVNLQISNLKSCTMFYGASVLTDTTEIGNADLASAENSGNILSRVTNPPISSSSSNIAEVQIRTVCTSNLPMLYKRENAGNPLVVGEILAGIAGKALNQCITLGCPGAFVGIGHLRTWIKMYI